MRCFCTNIGQHRLLCSIRHGIPLGQIAHGGAHLAVRPAGWRSGENPQGPIQKVRGYLRRGVYCTGGSAGFLFIEIR